MDRITTISVGLKISQIDCLKDMKIDNISRYVRDKIDKDWEEFKGKRGKSLNEETRTKVNT